MRKEVSFLTLLRHVVGAIYEIYEVTTRVHSHDYFGALPHAVRAAGHIREIIAKREALKTAGENLSKRIERLQVTVKAQIKRLPYGAAKRDDDDS